MNAKAFARAIIRLNELLPICILKLRIKNVSNASDAANHLTCSQFGHLIIITHLSDLFSVLPCVAVCCCGGVSILPHLSARWSLDAAFYRLTEVTPRSALLAPSTYEPVHIIYAFLSISSHFIWGFNISSKFTTLLYFLLGVHLQTLSASALANSFFFHWWNSKQNDRSHWFQK